MRLIGRFFIGLFAFAFFCAVVMWAGQWDAVSNAFSMFVSAISHSLEVFFDSI